MQSFEAAHRARPAAALFCLSALAGCGDAAVEACAPVPGFAVVLDTGVPAANARLALTFTQLWRRGGTNEGEDLAEPVSIAVSRQGRLAIADFGLSEAILIAPDGQWLEPVARRGAGPGEIRSVLAVAWDDAERLAVFDVMNARILFHHADDGRSEDAPLQPAFAAAVMASGGLIWAGLAPDGTAYAQPMGTGETYGGDAMVSVIRGEPGGVAHDTVARAHVPHITQPGYAGRALPGAPQPRVAVRDDGSFAVLDGAGGYAIRIHSPDGAPGSLLCRRAPALPLTAHERGSFHDSLAQNEYARNLSRSISAVASVTQPAYAGRMFFDADGRLWVQRERPDPLDFRQAIMGVPGARYDLFSREGRYLGELRAPDRLRIQAAFGETVYGFETTEDGAHWVVAYAVPDLPAR